MAIIRLRGTLVPARESQPCASDKTARAGTPVGPDCERCHATEARCAWTGGCCDACTHFGDLDANGEDIDRPVGRPRKQAS